MRNMKVINNYGDYMYHKLVLFYIKTHNHSYRFVLCFIPSLFISFIFTLILTTPIMSFCLICALIQFIITLLMLIILELIQIICNYLLINTNTTLMSGINSFYKPIIKLWSYETFCHAWPKFALVIFMIITSLCGIIIYKLALTMDYPFFLWNMSQYNKFYNICHSLNYNLHLDFNELMDIDVNMKPTYKNKWVRIFLLNEIINNASFSQYIKSNYILTKIVYDPFNIELFLILIKNANVYIFDNVCIPNDIINKIVNVLINKRFIY